MLVMTKFTPRRWRWVRRVGTTRRRNRRRQGGSLDVGGGSIWEKRRKRAEIWHPAASPNCFAFLTLATSTFSTPLNLLVGNAAILGHASFVYVTGAGPNSQYCLWIHVRMGPKNPSSPMNLLHTSFFATSLFFFHFLSHTVPPLLLSLHPGCWISNIIYHTARNDIFVFAGP